MKKVILKNSTAEKITSGFPWAYRNEIMAFEEPVEAGELVRLHARGGSFLGIGYVNPLSQITVRVLCSEDRAIDKDFLTGKISKALQKRHELRTVTTAYRLVHSEADELPGLVVDRYADFLAVQINTAGMERLRPLLLPCLVETIQPIGIYEKSEERFRAKEGLTTEERTIHGRIPESILIEEHGARFIVRLKESQKTGFYLDQRRNRQRVALCVKDRFDVLDLFSNTGGFGIHAALRGARSVKLVDISAAALKQAEENARLNRLQTVETARADVFGYIREAYEKGRFFDMIIVDPPSFAQSRRTRESAVRAFRQLISGCLRLLRNGGILAVFSCSHAVSLEDLQEASLKAAGDSGTKLDVLDYLIQDIDHPVLLHIPNSLYLKGLLFRKEA
ncbi:MAG TPA: class I SAM-dependent rRNA methyltransferase [Syntrophales bacterium]|nr:class I SAM-dependent rRNA methyltransferase [Syntrophales bacterium]HOX95640.1 class I SAM-dependent rRNA methyltransferase [Syntrophales bacterium]HPN25407.1 class I SAM-dependent rRNA methyltransferase [Syntrophales bacterium]HQM29889.1 class I SAM-dependent rRNA methyltransferase [Syntrophales bacterium]